MKDKLIKILGGYTQDEYFANATKLTMGQVKLLEEIRSITPARDAKGRFISKV